MYDAGKISLVLAPVPPLPLEVWDNDGIVNTASMFWPKGKIVLVQGDHLDIVGHYQLVKAPADQQGGGIHQPARIYQAYDSFQSWPRFNSATFKRIWSQVFDFSTNFNAGEQRTQPKSPEAAAAAA